MGGILSGLPRKLRVFLCHAKEDKPAVRDLYRMLAADGLQPGLDEEDLLPGVEWEPAIEEAVQECDVVLVCLSRTSISKTGVVQKEMAIALDAADLRPAGTVYIIPLRLEESEVPKRLGRWQWVDLWDDAGYRRLVRSLRKRDTELQGDPAGRDQATSPSVVIGQGYRCESHVAPVRAEGCGSCRFCPSPTLAPSCRPRRGRYHRQPH